MCGGGNRNPITGQDPVGTGNNPVTTTGPTPLDPILTAAMTVPGAGGTDLTGAQRAEAIAQARLHARMLDGLRTFFTSTSSAGANRQLDWRGVPIGPAASVAPPPTTTPEADPGPKPIGPGPLGGPARNVDPGVAALGPDFTDPTLETPLDNGPKRKGPKPKAWWKDPAEEDPIVSQERRLRGAYG